MTKHEQDAGAAADGLDQERRAYVEEFALLLNQDAGMPLTDARVLGYLMLTRVPYSSSADLQAALGASSGSISMATRRLVESGFLKRHPVPGERAHYFRADTDVWGSWLASERRYIDREGDMISRGLDIVEQAGNPEDAVIRERLRNGRDYMQWLKSYHHKMLAEWEAFKAARDAQTETEQQ